MTKQESRFSSYGIISDLMLSLIMFLAVQSLEIFVMYGYISSLGMEFKFLIIPVFYAVAFLIIRRIRMPQYLMLASHLAFAALSVFAVYTITGAGVEEVVAIIISAFLQMVYSLKQRYNSKDFVVRSDVLYLALTVNMFSFIVISYFKRADFLTIILINSILAVTMYFVARQNVVLDVSYYHLLSSHTQNVSSVKKQNRMSTILIVLGIAITLLLLNFFPTEEVTEALISLFAIVLRFVLRILYREEDAPSDDGRPKRDIDIPLNYEEESIVSQIAFKIIVLLVFLVAVVALFIVIVSTIRAVMAKYNVASDRKLADSDGSVVDLIENLSKNKKNKRVSRDFGKGYEKEIRKKFYSKVHKAIRAGMPLGRTSTPRHIERVLKEKGDTSITELIDSYEEVRYKG